MSDLNFVRGMLLSFDTNYNARSRDCTNLLSNPGTKTTRKRAKQPFFGNFWTLAHPGQQPARLGKLPLPQMAFSINSHAGEGFKGFNKFGIEEKTQEEEEKRSRGVAESRPWVIPYIASLASPVPCATSGQFFLIFLFFS